MESLIKDNLVEKVEEKIENKLEENETDQMKSLSLLELEEFLKSGRIPPGIKEYDDLPPLETQKASENKIERVKKPWETDENLKNLNFINNEEI